MKDKAQLFQEKLKIKFKDKSLLRKALTHRSCQESPVGNNERLEFLGDSIVGIVITEYLYLNTKLNEGKMAKIKSIAVGRAIMYEIAKKHNLERFVYVGKSEENEKDKKSLLANVLEALIGAYYLENGLDITRKLILHLWKPFLTRIMSGEYRDYKSELQEILQKNGYGLPIYKLLNSTGPDHNKTFVIGCFIGDKQYGQGIGKNKKAAEMKAAEEAFKKIILEIK